MTPVPLVVLRAESPACTSLGWSEAEAQGNGILLARPVRPSELVPDIPFIHGYPVLFAKPAELCLEILLPMMLLLDANILPHRVDMGVAYAECPVSCLPCKVAIPAMLFLKPAGGHDLTCSTTFASATFFDCI